VRETEVEIEKRKLAGQHHDLGALVRRYIDEIGAVKPWARTHKANLVRFARDVSGVTLADLTPDWLRSYGLKRRVSPATLAQEMYYLSSVLRTAEAWWGVPVDWSTFRKGRQMLRQLRLTGKAKERERRPQPGELERIKAAVRSTLPMADIIDFAVITGLRVNEICRIRWADLDERRRCVLVRQRKHPREKETNDQWVPLLGAAWGIVPRQERRGEAIFPYDHRSVSAAFQKARNAAGVEGLRFHDLRHDAISAMFEQGFAIPEVAMVSGHRDWNQLRRYTNLKPEGLHAGPLSKRGPAVQKTGRANHPDEADAGIAPARGEDNPAGDVSTPG
jgi:integrase